MSTVYVIRDGGYTEPMSRVRCNDEDQELQLILERNPDLLPGEQIDPEDPRRWLLLKREMPVPDPSTGIDRWSIDFLFADQSAVPTFVECKRRADTRARREIVGQMLEYAANGPHYWTAETLKEVAGATAARLGSSLEESVRNLRPDDELSVDAYFDGIQKNLREGRLRIVFFLEDSPTELRSVVDFLNGQMERAEILLVEARQFSHAGSRVVVPTLFGYTEAARLAKRASSSSSAGSRRRWDRATYLADAAERLSPEQVQSLESLLDQCYRLGCQVSWGTGARTGSFNVKEPTACSRSILTCWSNGELTFNFWWLNGSETALRAQARLRDLVIEDLGFPPGTEERPIAADAWSPKAEAVAGIIEKLVHECRTRQASSERRGP